MIAREAAMQGMAAVRFLAVGTVDCRVPGDKDINRQPDGTRYGADTWSIGSGEACSPT